MPQQSMFPDHHPEMGTYVLAIAPPTTGRSGFQVTVSVAKTFSEPPMPIWVGTFEGVMTDLLTSFAKEVTGAWLWGEDRRGVTKEAASVHRAARLHRSSHEY